MITGATHVRRFVAVASLLSSLFAACGGGGQRPAVDGGDAGSPDGQAALEVIIPHTTKVVDPDTRAALTAFDPDGTLRFSRGTAVLNALAPGDVMVSEPAAAAPHGFLRRVMAVDRSGAGVAVSTAGATLSDAIEQGELLAQRELTPAMLASGARIIRPPLPGGTGVRRGEDEWLMLGEGTRLLAAEDGYPFFVQIDASLGDNIKASGFLGFGLSLDFQVRLGAKWLPPFVKVEHVRAGLGVRQKGSLKLEAGGGVTVGTSVTVAVFPFTPIVFAIGPVPVVITPILKIQVGAKGQVTASLTYSVAEELPFAAGLDYNPKDGWRAYSTGTPRYESSNVDAKVNAAVEVSAGARGELLLYGLAGGFAEISGFLKLDAQVPRYPIWKLTGGVDASVGLSLDLIVARYEARENIARISLPIADAPNALPSINIATPAQGATVDSAALGGIRLLAAVSDLEDGTSCCAVSWTDDKGEPIPDGKDVMASFSTTGVHIIRATATDQQGGTSSATVSINVTRKPPTVTIVRPTASQTGLAVGVPAQVEGKGMDGLGLLPCPQLTWSSDVVADSFTDGGRGCRLTVTFATEGKRTLTLTGINDVGVMGTAVVDVMVGPRPIAPVVSVFIKAPAPGSDLRYDFEHTLSGEAHDMGNGLFRDFVWRVRGCGVDQVIGTTLGGTTSTLAWRPSTSGLTGCAQVDLTLTVTPEDGRPAVTSDPPTRVSTYRLQ